jgi:hypothetical protein
MDTLLKADIFFFIASLGVVAVTIAILITSYYIIRVVRKVERLEERLAPKVHATSEGVQEMVEDIKDSSVFRLFFKKKKITKK